MFQRSFADEDGWNEDLLLEAADDCENKPSEGASAHKVHVSYEVQSPSKRRRIEEYFSSRK